MRKLLPLPLVFCLAIDLTMASLRADADDSYLIKFKTHPDIGKTALVQEQETMHSHSKLVGLEAKSILENNEEEQSANSKYRETILEDSKDQDNPTRLRRDYEKAQSEVGGKTAVLPWQGKTILIEKKKDRYRFSVEGGQELTGKDAEPLADEFQPMRGSIPNFLVSPDKAVHVDEKHDIDPKVLLKVFAMGEAGIKVDAAKANGSWTLTRAYKKQGRQFGIVELHVQLPLLEMSSSPQSNPKATEKLVMRPGAKMTLDAVIDGCIDGSAAIATSKVDMEISGNAIVPSRDNPQFDLILSIKTSTRVTSEDSSSPQP